jgi:hypothetical protein
MSEKASLTRWLRGRFRQPHTGTVKENDHTGGEGRTRLAQVRARVEDDSAGWVTVQGRQHDYDHAEIQELYADALVAWRKNPIAFRIISITTDYVVGDSIQVSSPLPGLDAFIQAFWNHPQNRMPLRLEAMCDELSRSGDLFVALFRSEADGMSYLRFITKDRIERIDTAENDWENEQVYYEAASPGSPRAWLSPSHPRSSQAPAVLLHYSVNRPVGALLGESDLTTMIPWLQRYSRMLEDRVRLHWAMRAFLWVITVPGSKMREKQEQYRVPPEAGSVIVKDDAESWEPVSPQLHAADASHDLEAVRGMIDAGSGYPPHWRGESGQANLATATAMQAPTERHLLRRQQTFRYILEDILYQAYQRAVEAGRQKALPTTDFQKLFTLTVPDISRADNESLARSARDLAGALQGMNLALQPSRSLQKLALRMVFKFAGEPQPEDVLETILDEWHASQTKPKKEDDE